MKVFIHVRPSQIQRVKTLGPQLFPASGTLFLLLDRVLDAGVAEDVSAVGRHQMAIVALDFRLIVDTDWTREFRECEHPLRRFSLLQLYPTEI